MRISLNMLTTFKPTIYILVICIKIPSNIVFFDIKLYKYREYE